MSFLLSAIQWWSDNEPERPALEYLDKVYTISLYTTLYHPHFSVKKQTDELGSPRI